MKLGILYNARSGRHRKRWARPDLSSRPPMVEAQTAAQIDSGLAELAGHGVELLAVAGGDGTVRAVLSQLMLGHVFARPPLLALVPTGSTNMTGKDVGTVSVKRGGWQRLAAWADRPGDIERRVVNRPVLKIEPGGGAPAFCGMFFGAGAIYHAVAHTQGSLHHYGLRGDIGPGVTLMRFIKALASGDRRHFAPVKVALHDSHGHALDDDSILLLASTLRTLVLRLRPFWGHESGDLAWTAIAQNADGFLRRLPAICRGRRRRWTTPARGYHSHNSDRLELLFDGGYIVDGEFFTARTSDGPVVLSTAGAAAFLNLSG